MACLLRCFLLMILITPTANAKLFPPGSDCLEKVLKSIAGKNVVSAEKIKLTAAANYNDQIFKSMDEFSEEVIDNFAKYDTKLNAKQFKAWLKENPGDIKPKTKIGEYLNERYQPYKKIHPEVDLKRVAAEFPEDLKAIVKDCGESIPCNEKKIESLLLRKLNGTCIGEFKKEALRSMVTGLALTNAGYFISYAKHPENGYPFDLMASNLFWTPIVSEMGCRNTLSQGEIGKKINFGQLSIKEKIKIGANNYIQYMALSPLTNVTYVAFHTTKQLIKGEKNWEDVNMLDLAKQVGSLTIYDAIYPVPRMVLITDPLFMKGFPQLRNFYYKKIPFKVGAEGSYLLTDGAARIGLSFVNTEIFNAWIKQTDEPFGTGFEPKKAAPIATPAPLATPTPIAKPVIIAPPVKKTP